MKGGSRWLIWGVSPPISLWLSNAIGSITQSTSLSTATLRRSWRSSEWMSRNELPCQWQWSFTWGSLREETCDPTIYQSMIGNLMYLMAGTRPDIAYALRVVSQYHQDPSNEHMVPLEHVFLYLNGTEDCWLRFWGALGEALWDRALGGEGKGALVCYVNSDYAGCPDDYKSTDRLVITFRGAVDCRARQQKSTVQSTIDAKYYPLRVGCMRLTQICHLLNELGITTIPHVISDSQSLMLSWFEVRISLCQGLWCNLPLL